MRGQRRVRSRNDSLAGATQLELAALLQLLVPAIPSQIVTHSLITRPPSARPHTSPVSTLFPPAQNITGKEIVDSSRVVPRRPVPHHSTPLPSCSLPPTNSAVQLLLPLGTCPP